MEKPVIIVSDIHLGAVPERTERAFREFLGWVQREGSELLINGDLFDFWFEYRTVIPRKHFRVVAKIAEVVEAGVPVTFIGGNHDAWAGSFLSGEVGMRLLDGPVEMTLAGRRTLVAHGDGVGRGDYKYRALRKVIRHPVSIGAFRILHPDLGGRIAGMASTTKHKAGGEEAAARGRASFIEAWARERLAEDAGLDLVVAGHAHVPSVVEAAPGRFYANAGDWIRNYTYLVLRPGTSAPELHTWPVDGEQG
ncbi:MAG TPA: UDP-2,3-diacylglucosamine diphosphatase [Longimicrobiaceae bacterium]|jgi:UDP-2,3-diacylglucosamine hydrolase|nr:UDP-2,3-diacylglucosamine diphosphatase [Longimicrobiaceae bacterium]